MDMERSGQVYRTVHTSSIIHTSIQRFEFGEARRRGVSRQRAPQGSQLTIVRTIAGGGLYSKIQRVCMIIAQTSAIWTLDAGELGGCQLELSDCCGLMMLPSQWQVGHSGKRKA